MAANSCSEARPGSSPEISPEAEGTIAVEPHEQLSDHKVSSACSKSSKRSPISLNLPVDALCDRLQREVQNIGQQLLQEVRAELQSLSGRLLEIEQQRHQSIAGASDAAKGRLSVSSKQSRDSSLSSGSLSEARACSKKIRKSGKDSTSRRRPTASLRGAGHLDDKVMLPLRAVHPSAPRGKPHNLHMEALARAKRQGEGHDSSTSGSSDGDSFARSPKSSDGTRLPELPNVLKAPLELSPTTSNSSSPKASATNGKRRVSVSKHKLRISQLVHGGGNCFTDEVVKRACPVSVSENSEGESFPIQSNETDSVDQITHSATSADEYQCVRHVESHSIKGIKRMRENQMASLRESTVRDDPVMLTTEDSWREKFWLLVALHFDNLMGFVLFSNAIWIGVQVDLKASPDFETRTKDAALAIDLVFCLVFVAELAFRIFTSGWSFFSFAPGWKWNLFDVIVVTLQVIEQAVSLWAGGTEASAMIEQVGFMRMLRIGRLARLVRMVRLIPELKNMVYLLLASMSSFLWALVLLFLMMYIVSVYFTESARDILLTGDITNEQVASITSYWGSIGDSVFTLYKAISGGGDWNEYVAVFSRSASSVHVVIFSCYIAFVTLVMLNLVTGVFVEGAQRILREDFDREIAATAGKLFAQSDTDYSRTLSWKEWAGMVGSPQMLKYCEVIGFDGEPQALFNILDRDKNKVLSLEEFVKGCIRLKGPARIVDIEQLTEELRDCIEILDRRSLSTHSLLSDLSQRL